jgi:16S rRNA (adenine1518-N6/adenine1519-N6)-dimethyltransferase
MTSSHLGHQARKRFGQDFLVDANIIRQIMAAIAPQPGQNMVEIGPGLGALTAPLIDALGHLKAIELDRDLIARLQTRFSPAQLSLHAGDALSFDFEKLGPQLRVVGNLPYNISSPLLFHLANQAQHVHDMTFMLQKEVVMRMVAPAGHPDYARLSVMLQYHFDMAHLFDVPPEAFKPAPKVTSAIVRLRPKPAHRPRAQDEACFAALVAAAFGQRRKTVRNTLKTWVSEADFAKLGIDPGLRAERLSLTDFIALSDGCSKGSGHDDPPPTHENAISV